MTWSMKAYSSENILTKSLVSITPLRPLDLKEDAAFEIGGHREKFLSERKNQLIVDTGWFWSQWFFKIWNKASTFFSLWVFPWVESEPSLMRARLGRAILSYADGKSFEEVLLIPRRGQHWHQGAGLRCSHIPC